MKPPPFTYCVAGRYWYFRRAGLLEALIGFPGESSFERSYAESFAKAEARIVAKERDKARRARNARERRAQIERQLVGTIYFIGARTGPIKIGFTTDLNARLLRLQMNSPKRLRVLAAYPGTRRDEMMLHRKHEASRLHGEWFRRTTALMEEMAEATSAAGTDEAQTVIMLNAQDSCAKAA